MEIDEISRYLTAFRTVYGLFEWCRLPMGLKGAGSYYQSHMQNTVLGDLLYVICEAYLDDILLKSRTEDENVHNTSNRDQLKADEVLLSGDIMTCAGILFNIMVLVTPGDVKTCMVFGEMLEDHKSETLTASVVRIGRHVTDKYGLNIGIVEFDR